VYDLLGLLPGMLSITEPGVAGGRVERELARIKHEVVLGMLGAR